MPPKTEILKTKTGRAVHRRDRDAPPAFARQATTVRNQIWLVVLIHSPHYIPCGLGFVNHEAIVGGVMPVDVKVWRHTMRRDPESPYSVAAISRRLFLLRKGLGLSQAEMGAHAGVSGNAWGNYESGAGRISLDAAIQLENSLSVPQEWVYRGVSLRLTDDLRAALANAQKAVSGARRA